MDSLVLTPENILCHLRQNCLNKGYVQIIRLLENVEKQEFSSKSQKYEILEELLQILRSRPINNRDTDGAVVFSSVILLTCLQEQQKLPCLTESQFADLWFWLLEQYKSNEINTDNVCRIIIVIGNLFVLHPEYSDKYFVSVFHMLLSNLSPNAADVVVVTTLQCLKKLLMSLKDGKLSDEQCTACTEAGHKLLQLHYNETEALTSSNISVLVVCTLQILRSIVALNPNFAKLQTAELLGLSKAYFNFGLDVDKISLLKPQKVFISQQALYDSVEEIETVIISDKARRCGGKIPKSRKPRAVTKNIRSNDYMAINRSSEDRCGVLLFDMKTSDSDISEPENVSNRVLFERSRNAKIRLSAISLVESVARNLERKVLFGYWHALFPSGTGDSNDNLFYIGQHDPNIRCRSAALQVCALLLYGSKGYLHQAEINIKHCPTTFIPFSVSLGYTVLAIYKSLTVILSSEPSLPVLTQALKCLAVLVQASPLKQFEKGFVQGFVKVVKPLVYHRDAAIQVSALMVMEFLLAQWETTCDIAEAIGISEKDAIKNRTQLQRMDDEEIDAVDIEEFVESEEENFIDKNKSRSTKTEFLNTPTIEKTSWLLLRVLYNLSKLNKMPSTVRIESLQILIVMSPNFSIIKPHLVEISEVLLYSLKDVLSDVRLYAARCMDACAFQISRYLLENPAYSDSEIGECNQFWINMMPFVMNHIRRDSEEITSVRIALCDALSNIGAFMFEHTPNPNQISLLSFLSCVSSDSLEDTIVRAASARALAVFALYPSLRGDLVFIENTAELTLRLVKDSNLLVRIKSFWSLGNISDALIGKGIEIGNLQQERISDDLLFRLITVATEACSDNDKVRCNAVRTLGNLLRLLNEEHLNSDNGRLNWHDTFLKSICKLSDCIRSSGNAKVKWNSCYAISNLMRNPAIFKVSDLSWQGMLFPALCHVIIHHSNFKVRINASAAITSIIKRSYFGPHYEHICSSVLEAIEQSYNLDNFYEYNHRDSLQEQLCLSLSHIVTLAINDDLPMLRRYITLRTEIIRTTWKRVINRMVPEKAAPLLSCPVVLLERRKHETLTSQQKEILEFLIEIFST